MPETTSARCPYIPCCPVYRIHRLFTGSGLSLWQVIEQLDRERQAQLAKRLESREPIRTTVEQLSKENAALRSYKRRAELFLLSKGLSLPED